MNNSQQITLVITPMITGLLSALASVTILFMIRRSTIQLSTTYRRLFFILSTFDLTQALSQCVSTLPMPIGSSLWSSGNDFTCDLQGFFTIVGCLGALWYSLSIAIYFYLVIKYNINDERIKNHYEPFLHITPIFLSLTTGLYLVLTNNLNTAGESCWIAPEPIECMDNPDIECLSIGDPITARYIFCIQFFISFSLNCVIMFSLWHTVYARYRTQQLLRVSWIQKYEQPAKKRSSFIWTQKQQKALLANIDYDDDNDHRDGDGDHEEQGEEEKMEEKAVTPKNDVESYSSSYSSDSTSKKIINMLHQSQSQQQTEQYQETKQKSKNSISSLLSSSIQGMRNIFSKTSRSTAENTPNNNNNNNNNSTSQPSPLAMYMSRPCTAYIKKQREITNRSLAFISGFIMTYIFSVAYRAYEMIHKNQYDEDHHEEVVVEAPFMLKLLARFFFPLQGFINVIVYTSPHIANLRRDNEDLTWISAFWKVVTSGGDKDQSYGGNNNNDRISNGRRNSTSSMRSSQILSFPLRGDSGGDGTGTGTGTGSTYTFTRGRDKQPQSFQSARRQCQSSSMEPTSIDSYAHSSKSILKGDDGIFSSSFELPIIHSDTKSESKPKVSFVDENGGVGKCLSSSSATASTRTAKQCNDDSNVYKVGEEKQELCESYNPETKKYNSLYMEDDNDDE